ncbi:MAG: glycosyltransferase family 2 protein [Microcoleaceae cyanobacterium]
MSRISVIIPTYNAEKTIRETVRSVIKQSFSNWELLIVDDGSNDKTLDIIAQFSDPRIHVFTYSNAGVSTSRNRGLAKASGEFVAFLDHDDLWTSDKLEAQFQALQVHPEAALSYSWTDHCDESDQVTALGRHATFDGNVYAQLLVDNFLDTASNPLIRKTALDRVGDFDCTIDSAGEWDLYLRLAAQYPFAVVSKSQVLHRVSSRAMSANIDAHKHECLATIERAFRQAPASLQHLKKASLANIYKYLLCKTLEGKPQSQKGRKALSLLWNYIQYEANLRSQSQFILTMFLKSLTIIVLPSKQAEKVLERSK